MDGLSDYNVLSTAFRAHDNKGFAIVHPGAHHVAVALQFYGVDYRGLVNVLKLQNLSLAELQLFYFVVRNHEVRDGHLEINSEDLL